MKHLDQLTRHCCRWIDEPRSQLYCGEAVVPETSWCMVHHRKVFQPPTMRRHPRLPTPVDLIPVDAPPEPVLEPPDPEVMEE
jgi:hypothetical protein